MPKHKKLPPLKMPDPIDDSPENVMKRVMGFHAPEGKYPFSKDGRWPHEIEYEEETDRLNS